MFLLPLEGLLKLDRMRPFQELVARGWLVRYAAAMLARVIFVTHQWLGWNHPDPMNVQLLALQRLLRTLMEGKTDVHPHWQAALTGTTTNIEGSRWAEVLPHMLCWLDYCCIPQPGAAGGGAADHRFSGDNAAQQLGMAVQSIPAYIERTALIIVLAPSATHTDTHESCNVSSWRSRGWCRMEYLSAALARNPIPTMIYGNRAPHFNFPKDFCCLSAGGGEFSCCTRGHNINGTSIPCDRAKVKLILEQLLDAKVTHEFERQNLLGARSLASFKGCLLRGLGPLEASGVTCSPRPEHLEQAWDAVPIVRLKQRLRWRDAAQEGAFQRETGTSLLHWAACANDGPGVRALLSARADLHLCTGERCATAGMLFSGATPLHLAMCFADWEIVRIILDARADPEARFSCGAFLTMGLFEVAAFFNRVDMLPAAFERFPHSGSGWALNWAARAGSLPLVRLLLAARAGVDRCMENGVGHALRWAAGLTEDASVPIARALLAARADPNNRDRPVGLFAAVCAVMKVAFYCGFRRELCIILANNPGVTALHYATGLNPNPEMVRLLLDARAEATTRTDLGMCPLDFARALGGGAVPADVVDAFPSSGEVHFN